MTLFVSASLYKNAAHTKNDCDEMQTRRHSLKQDLNILGSHYDHAVLKSAETG